MTVICFLLLSCKSNQKRNDGIVLDMYAGSPNSYLWHKGGKDLRIGLERTEIATHDAKENVTLELGLKLRIVLKPESEVGLLYQDGTITIDLVAGRTKVFQAPKPDKAIIVKVGEARLTTSTVPCLFEVDSKGSYAKFWQRYSRMGRHQPFFD